MTPFDVQKSTCASKLDLSRKGSVDEPILDLIRDLNAHPDLFTLSSCSGRIVLFRSRSDVAKKGCDWMRVAHEKIHADDVWSKVEDNNDEGVLTLKFEPFILHLQCRTLELAKKLHTVSLESGFKNTGLTLGKKDKFVLAVRSSHCLEIPLTDESGRLLVDRNYVDFAVNLANSKLDVNLEKHKKFERRFRHFVENVENTSEKTRKIHRTGQFSES